MPKRGKMSLSKIYNVDVISNTRAVVSRVIVTEYHNLFTLTNCRLADERH